MLFIIIIIIIIIKKKKTPTFEHLADVEAEEVDPVVVVERAVPVGDAVLRDVDGDVVVVVLEPVHHLPDPEGSHPKPARPGSDHKRITVCLCVCFLVCLYSDLYQCKIHIKHVLKHYETKKEKRKKRFIVCRFMA